MAKGAPHKALQTSPFSPSSPTHLTPPYPQFSTDNTNRLICRDFKALFRTRTGDPLLTMNVRRGPTHAGLRVVARARSCRESPRFAAFCMAVRPWCDLRTFAGN
jgi:hypothetical protein